MEIRGIHLDLKGCFPRYEYLEEIIGRLAYYKINTLLIEYEDKFRYEKHPEISHPLSLSKERVKNLIQIAEKHHIQLIPLVQCLGHVQYILKHKKYAYLRELEDDVSQYCPSNPDTFKLYTDFLEEILPLHKNSNYFHIGADETRLLGKCSRCKEIARKKGEIGLYIEYIKKVCAYLLDKGKIPILWDDIITRSKNIEHSVDLPKETTIMYWDYGAEDEKTNYLLWEGKRISKRWLKKFYKDKFISYPSSFSGFIEDIPIDIVIKYKKYWNKEKFPLYINSFPFVKLIQEKGYRVIGASACAGDIDHFLFMPDFNHRIRNIRTWAKRIKEEDGLGVITTTWARASSFAPPKAPFEILWYGIVASAEYYWSADLSNMEDFDRRFNHRFFGMNNSDITDGIFLLDISKDEIYENYAGYVVERFEKLSNKIKRNNLSFKYLSLASEIIHYKRLKKSIFNKFVTYSYEKIEKKTLDKSRLTEILNWIVEMEKKLERLKEKTKKILSLTMPECEVEEKVNSLFKLDEEEIKKLIKLLKKD